MEAGEAEGSLSAGQGRWVWMVVAAVALLVLAGVVVAVVSSGSDDEKTAEPTSTTTTTMVPSGLPAPDPELAGATLDYLDGDGAVLLVMHEQAIGYPELGDEQAACDAAATELDETADPDEVLGRTGEVPDPVLEALLYDERTSLGAAITGCVTGEAGQDERVTALGDAADLVAVRLAELEEAA